MTTFFPKQKSEKHGIVYIFAIIFKDWPNGSQLHSSTCFCIPSTALSYILWPLETPLHTPKRSVRWTPEKEMCLNSYENNLPLTCSLKRSMGHTLGTIAVNQQNLNVGRRGYWTWGDGLIGSLLGNEGEQTEHHPFIPWPVSESEHANQVGFSVRDLTCFHLKF